MPRCRQRAEWLNASKGRRALRCIAWHGQSATVSRLTSLFRRVLLHINQCCPFSHSGASRPLERRGEREKRERRRKRHEAGITGETEELTISTICTTVYITSHYGTLCLRAHDGCPRWCRPLLAAIMLVKQASRQGSKEARKQARRALPCDSRPQALPITQCPF
jgi:hypothetical protein